MSVAGFVKFFLLLPVTSNANSGYPYAGIVGLVKRSDKIVRQPAQRCCRDVHREASRDPERNNAIAVAR
jgi:hypothetical protein